MDQYKSSQSVYAQQLSAPEHGTFEKRAVSTVCHSVSVALENVSRGGARASLCKDSVRHQNCTVADKGQITNVPKEMGPPATAKFPTMGPEF